jgi:hypothetical protein
MVNDPFWSNFWLNFSSNLFATLIGIVVGLPAALWLDRKARAKNELEKAYEAKQRAAKILSILLAEIEDDLVAMSHFHEDMANEFYPVRTESWRAFSDGGELQWINDPELLNQLSMGYAEIDHYSFVLEKYFDAYFHLERSGNLRLTKPLFQNVIKIRESAIKKATSVKELLRVRLADSVSS